jgi:HAD superfamily hydrolase (TIGR01509 family)
MAPMSAAAGIVFDNDGLLLDTEPCWTRAQEQVFERRGATFDLEAKRALVGTAPETATLVLERFFPGGGEEASTEMYDLAVEAIGAGAEPRPGALDLLSELRGRWPLAIASNAPRRHLLTGLRRVGVEDAFGGLVAIDDVGVPKPAPDLYLRACELVGLDPLRSVALEDSPPGVAAAKAAGMLVIGIPSIEGVELDADQRFSTLADPGVLAVIERTLGDGDRG